MTFYCGYVSIIGETNVGKSTLINKLIAQKVSIVSPKSQTSRFNTLGIYNDANSQIVFVDTPGLHKNTKKLDEIMQQNVLSSFSDADLLLYVIDGKKDLKSQYQKLLKNSKIPSILLVNKIDESSFERLYPQLKVLSKISDIKEILPISALKGTNCDILIEIIKKYLPKFDFEMRYFPPEQFTDKTEKELVAEIIREKILYLLEQEVPHGIAVDITKFEQTDKLTAIEANIITEKQSHKNIIVGNKGETIKKISISARKDIEKFLQQKVFLELFVKVKAGWRNNLNSLRELGFENSKSE